MKNVLVKLLLLLLVCFLVGVYFVWRVFGLFDMCGNQEYGTYISPNKELKAIIFQRDCGATSSFSTQISILQSTEQLENESGNVFIIEGHPSDVALELKWLNDATLLIPYELDGSEYLAKENFKSDTRIKIYYKK